ncbi:carbon catabolite repressor protein 4 homolog 1-like isoform X1 [Vitis riparia]|uniref:carbon catabolite repressor protein 4 homolog 1-like isoform X1 n=1 Tax=Vitis riparia TaxID=96939 RepID=UPI00155A9439|nr:carbon catabolite repressor protein 4 homolog 1-like isoform X1 [Vitis riparia]
MGLQESESLTCKVNVTLPYTTPVVGVKFKPAVRVAGITSLQAPQHNKKFSWYREKITCSVHHLQLATIQCMSCVALDMPVRESYYCSKQCFLDLWPQHKARHCLAAESVSKASNDCYSLMGRLRSSGSWTGFGIGSIFVESETLVEREGKTWIKVGSSETYVPSMDDFGFCLMFESLAIDCSLGFPLSEIKSIMTDPVIIPPHPCPRHMIQIQHLKEPRNIVFESQSSNADTFSVLSYNILSDIYASRNAHVKCPGWALAWEYRRKNLLLEITGYDADIICLQEVQSDHFENYFKPKLTKRGYSVTYKKKAMQVYTANQFISDGCATFFRHDRFKEIIKYELEFDKTALSVVEGLEPDQRTQGQIRLMKGNIALVIILERVENGSSLGAFQPRICVANTHIYANPNLPDVKLCQVASLVKGLEKIAQSQIPLLICGDMNSLPGSDPHKFLVTGRICPVSSKETADPLGIYNLLKLQHSIPLVSAYSSLLCSGRVKEDEKKKMNQETKEPVFTNLSGGNSSTLDYIFHTENDLEVEGLLELLNSETVGDALPSALWSSDHIALMANFRFKQAFCREPHSPPPQNPWHQAAPLS